MISDLTLIILSKMFFWNSTPFRWHNRAGDTIQSDLILHPAYVRLSQPLHGMNREIWMQYFISSRYRAFSYLTPSTLVFETNPFFSKRRKPTPKLFHVLAVERQLMTMMNPWMMMITTAVGMFPSLYFQTACHLRDNVTWSVGRLDGRVDKYYHPRDSNRHRVEYRLKMVT